MHLPSKDIIVLAVGLALTTTVVSMLTTVSSLSGSYLSPNPSLSTFPVTATVIGTLLMIYPASWLMGILGRKGGFMFKAGVGILGGIICCVALLLNHFYVLVLGALLLGIFSAFGQYYRFAAIDAAKKPKEHASAISVVMGAGVIGGIAGPFLSSHFSELFSPVPYVGSFVAIIAVCVFLALSQLFLSSKLGRTVNPISKVVKTPDYNHSLLSSNFIQISIICTIAFAVMTLAMNAAPLSLHKSCFSLTTASVVLQVHFIMMYLPSFFNPTLVKIIGLKGLVTIGVLASALGCLLTLLPNQTFEIYMIELGLSGIGWNFMFNGGTLLLAKTYSPAMKTKAQGLNSLFVYTGNIVASFSAGALMYLSGWQLVNLICIPLLCTSIFILWKLRLGNIT